MSFYNDAKVVFYCILFGEFKKADELQSYIYLEKFWSSAPIYDPENFTLIKEHELWS